MPLSNDEIEAIQEFERIGAHESQKRDDEWEVQVGNPNFQAVGYRDDYYECAWTVGRAAELLEAYLCWCQVNDETPEASQEWELDDPNVMAHVAYHGLMQEEVERWNSLWVVSPSR